MALLITQRNTECFANFSLIMTCQPIYDEQKLIIGILEVYEDISWKKILPRVLLPKKQHQFINGCDLNNEVSKWLMELEDKEVLHKSFKNRVLSTD